MTLADRPAIASPPPTVRLADGRTVARVVATGLTLEQYLALPDGETAREFDDGVVTEKVAPQADHGRIEGQFYTRFDGFGTRHRAGMAFTETRFVTPGWAPVPDVSYYRKERITPRSPRRFGDFDVPPDIAVEIVSPDQTVGELLRKCLRYADVGVAVSVVVDPDDESVFIVRPGQPLVALHGDDRINLDDVLPGFELTVRELFDSIVPGWLADNEAPDSQTAPDTQLTADG